MELSAKTGWVGLRSGDIEEAFQFGDRSDLFFIHPWLKVNDYS